MPARLLSAWPAPSISRLSSNRFRMFSEIGRPPGASRWSSPRRPFGPSICRTIRAKHTSASPSPASPIGTATTFRPSGRFACLAGGMSARLFTEVRERRGLCYTVFASQHSLQHLGSVLCYAGTSAERAQETLDVTVSELLRLAEGVSGEELDRVKARIKSSLIMQQEMSGARSSAVARDWFHLGCVRSIRELEEIGRRADAGNNQRLPRGEPPFGTEDRDDGTRAAKDAEFHWMK